MTIKTHIQENGLHGVAATCERAYQLGQALSIQQRIGRSGRLGVTADNVEGLAGVASRAKNSDFYRRTLDFGRVNWVSCHP